MATLICPRCFAEISDSAQPRFCPRCGLADVVKAALDNHPVMIHVDGRAYRVLDRLAVGSVASVYRCETIGAVPAKGVFKIARDARSNALLANEARALSLLAAAPDAPSFMAFLPRLVDSFLQGGTADEPARQANVLTYDSDIASPDDLYTLEEVRFEYPTGLDAKDVAWIWRRLLNTLGSLHANGVAHTAVLPAHVLIEPADHKLVLIDWCFAVTKERWTLIKNAAGTGGNPRWFAREGFPRRSSPALDISLGARCMIALLAGEAAELPPTLNPAVRRHLERCADLPDENPPQASELLNQFDRLIEALWGPRKFRPLTMPKRR